MVKHGRDPPQDGEKTQVVFDELAKEDQLFSIYGYEIKRASKNQYVIIDKEGTPKINFKTFSEATEKRIAKKLPDIPNSIITEQLAALAIIPPPDVSEESDGGKKSHATKIIEYALLENIEVFKDQFNSPYIRLPEKFRWSNNKKDAKDGKTTLLSVIPKKIIVKKEVNNNDIGELNRENSVLSVPNELDFQSIVTTRLLTSRNVRAWLSNLLFQKEGIAPSGEASRSAINVLIAMANEGVNRNLYNRVAPDGNNGIYLDITDPLWRAIHITRKGWELVENPPILFKRYAHQLPLFSPVKYGDPTRIFDLINVEGLGNQLLYLTSIVTSLIPDIPHVILVVWGEQGSGKTWFLLVPKMIIDNSGTELLSIPKQDKELIQSLDHHYLPYFDNLSSLTDDQSDLFCRAVTGLGFQKRELYSDDDDILKRFKRCIGMNGLNIPIAKGDFFDRSVIFECLPISDEKRIKESDLRDKIAFSGPYILGGFLDLISKAIRILPSIQLDTFSRMADFMAWGCAITEALGLDKEHFLMAYRANMKVHGVQAIRSNIVGDILIKYLNSRTEPRKEFTPTGLFSLLKNYAKDDNIDLRDFPANPTHLGRELNVIKADFPAVGWKIIRGKGRSSGRKIIFQKIDLTQLKDMQAVAQDSNNWGFGENLSNYYDPQAWELKQWREFSAFLIAPLLLSEKLERDSLSLQENMSFQLKILSEVENTINGDPVKIEEFIDLMVKTYGFEESEVKRIYDVHLKQDRVIWEPRPGYVKRRFP